MPSTKTFLTIVITTFKRPALLRECVQSILIQDFTDYEVIIINNDPETPITQDTIASTDERIEIINRSEWIFHIKNVNEALLRARGEYFTWIPDDDYYAPGFFGAMFAGLKANHFPPAAFSTHTSEQRELCQLPSSQIPAEVISGEGMLREFLSKKLPLIGVYGFLKTSYLRGLGGMLENRYCDLALVVQCAANEKIVLIRKPLVYFRKHEESESWTSVDLGSYIAAQKEWVRVSLPVFQGENLSKNFDEFLWRILEWCILDFYCVIARSPDLQLSHWFSYFRFILSKARLLGFSRWRIYKRIIFSFRIVAKSRWTRWRQTSIAP